MILPGITPGAPTTPTSVSFTAWASAGAALVFGIDYVGMTAEPEVGGIKTEEQAYMMFSIGYKHKF